jgi:GT2 family glycosyltransferase
MSEDSIDLSIIIINYNLAKEIEVCLLSLCKTLDTLSKLMYEVIVVDNNSPDKDLPFVEGKIRRSNIHFYYLDKNYGFGKGCNFGFTKAKGKYLCFLNPDTVINENIFDSILNRLKENVSIGIIAPQQQFRAPCFDFSAGFSPNIFFEICGLLGIGVFVEGMAVYFYTKYIKRELYDVRWVLGACFFMRAEVFRKVGGFDEDFFMFYEEVDLCKRILNSGLRVVYFPSAKIYHVGSVSGKKDYYLYTIRTYASKSIFISKHYKGIHKQIFIILLQLQMIVQTFIWIVLWPKNSEKSKQKIMAFRYLFKNKLRNTIP